MKRKANGKTAKLGLGWSIKSNSKDHIETGFIIYNRIKEKSKKTK